MFVLSHWLVDFDPSIVSLFEVHLLFVKCSWSVRGPFVGFVYTSDKVICEDVLLVVDICQETLLQVNVHVPSHQSHCLKEFGSCGKQSINQSINLFICTQSW